MVSGRGRFRTKLCRNFALGHCPQGENCNYIHASPETIQNDPNVHAMLSGRTVAGHDARSSQLSTIASPVWSTLSPTTQSSDQPNYHWGSSPTSNTAPTSRIKYRPLSWRTALCRHFVKNKGWCPMGGRCNYIHDLALADFARDDARFQSRRSSRGRADGKGKAGSKHSHCWAYVQGLCHVQDCQYLHPVAVHLFAPHTPCLSWPNCRRGPLCPYKHPEPYVSDSQPSSPTLSPTDTTAPAAALAQPDPVPRGAVPLNGMLYFNLAQPPPQPPSLRILEIPAPFGQPPMVLANPWDPWHLPYPPTPMTYMPIMVSPPAWPDNGAGSGTRWPESLNATAPYIPPAFSSLPEPASGEFGGGSMATGPAQTEKPVTFESALDHARGTSLPIPESEMPYIPPKHQKVGHARRVSVAIKSREDLDALALDSTVRTRQPWQTHGDRLGRRSWAPSSSSLHAHGALTPPAILYGM